MSAVSITVVGSFESVGAILVVALLVVPAAAAYLLSNRLSTMIAFAILIGIFSVALGYSFAWAWDASIAGGIATATGALFLVILLLSPQHGLLARILHHHQLSMRLSGDLLLLHLHNQGPLQSRRDLASRFGWNPAKLARVIRPLRNAELIEEAEDKLRLTPKGADRLAGDLKSSLS
jgi:manganese/zinc/iron transport system permease protein